MLCADNRRADLSGVLLTVSPDNRLVDSRIALSSFCMCLKFLFEEDRLCQKLGEYGGDVGCCCRRGGGGNRCLVDSLFTSFASKEHLHELQLDELKLDALIDEIELIDDTLRIIRFGSDRFKEKHSFSFCH